MLMKFKLSVFLKILVSVLCAVGLTSSYIYRQSFSIFGFFTNLSGLFSLIVFLSSAVYMIRKHKFISANRYAMIKGSCTVAAIITFLVYHFLLSGQASGSISNSNIFYNMSNILLHYVAPIFVLLDYLFFDIRGKHRLISPIYWAVFPLVYTVFVYVYSSFGGKFYIAGIVLDYPYFFYDIGELGILGVVIWLAVILAAFIILGYILVILDSFFYKRSRRNIIGTPVLR